MILGGFKMERSGKSDRLKRILIPAGVTIGIILLIGLLLYAFAIPFNVYIIFKLHTYVVTKIVNITGINQLLVKGIVIIAFIPLLWVIPHSYKGKHKNTARAIGLLYFGIFFLSLYGLIKDVNFAHSGREILKWYALTPDGVKFFDSSGVDPIYGITLRPVTPEVIRNLKLLQKGDFKPINPLNAQFFNPITGESQIWFYQYPDGSYEFYDKPGYHPITGVPLTPTTKEVYFLWREKVDKTLPLKPKGNLQDNKQQKGGELANVQESTLNQKDKQLKDFKSIINPGIILHSDKPNIAIVVEVPRTAIDISAESSLYNHLKSEKVHIVLNFFKEEEFKSKGYFTELFNGNTELLVRSGALEKVGTLILGKMNFSFRRDSQVERNLVSCDINFSYKSFNKDGGIVRNETLNVVGPGFSESTALKRGIELLAERYSDKILQSVK